MRSRTMRERSKTRWQIMSLKEYIYWAVCLIHLGIGWASSSMGSRTSLDRLDWINTWSIISSSLWSTEASKILWSYLGTLSYWVFSQTSYKKYLEIKKVWFLSSVLYCFGGCQIEVQKLILNLKVNLPFRFVLFLIKVEKFGWIVIVLFIDLSLWLNSKVFCLFLFDVQGHFIEFYFSQIWPVFTCVQKLVYVHS